MIVAPGTRHAVAAERRTLPRPPVGVGLLPAIIFEDKEEHSRGNEHSEGEITQPKENTSMGDRSPKSVQKQASQKQSKTNDSDKKKQALVTTQQATKAKAATAKKK